MTRKEWILDARKRLQGIAEFQWEQRKQREQLEQREQRELEEQIRQEARDKQEARYGQSTQSEIFRPFVDSSAKDASLLLQKVLDISQVGYLMYQDVPLLSHEIDELEALLQRRENSEPMAYILGYKEFYGLDFSVSSDTLIPRPETEFLVEEALKYISDASSILNANLTTNLNGNQPNAPFTLLDLGTGTGCIALSILYNSTPHNSHYKSPHSSHYSFMSQAICVDINEETIKIAKKNAHALKLQERAHFLHMDMLHDDFLSGLIKILTNISSNMSSNVSADISPKISSSNLSNGFSNNLSDISASISLIVSNPPYIDKKDYEQLHSTVKIYEPNLALVSELSGMQHLTCIAQIATILLKKGGLLLMEHGFDQGESVRNLFPTKTWDTHTGKDYAGLDRYIYAIKK